VLMIENPLGAVAYDEARKAVETQASLLDNLRSRASTILAAASLVTSFLGGQALAKPSISGGVVFQPVIGPLGWLAILAFVGVLLSTLAVLWPRGMGFDMEAQTILDATRGTTVSEQDGKAQLALYWDEAYRQNAGKLDRLLWLFAASCVLLAAETVLWLLDLR
jgi:hypothetical protein